VHKLISTACVMSVVYVFLKVQYGILTETHILLIIKPVCLYNFVEGLRISLSNKITAISTACIVAPNIVNLTREPAICRERLTMACRRSIRQIFTTQCHTLIFHPSQVLRLQNTATIHTMKVTSYEENLILLLLNYML